jgi:hypothetical protein
VNQNKVIVRLLGGLGNQMFGYAAARRLAIVNDAELIIDPFSGFVRDRGYHRKYELNAFNIAGRLATAKELLQPFERIRRAVFKIRESRKPFKKRRYLMQEGEMFEHSLVNFKLSGTTYIEGVWPSEKYFQDVTEQIRTDLALRFTPTAYQKDLSDHMVGTNSVAVHVRFFNPSVENDSSNIGLEYYSRAFETILERTGSAHFFIFSDQPEIAEKKLRLGCGEVTIVNQTNSVQNPHLDLWLMSMSRHAVIANSTFSWWGAWLGEQKNRTRIVIAPSPNRYPKMGWSSESLLPDRWIKL